MVALTIALCSLAVVACCYLWSGRQEGKKRNKPIAIIISLFTYVLAHLRAFPLHSRLSQRGRQSKLKCYLSNSSIHPPIVAEASWWLWIVRKKVVSLLASASHSHGQHLKKEMLGVIAIFHSLQAPPCRQKGFINKKYSHCIISSFTKKRHPFITYPSLLFHQQHHASNNTVI